jgi:nitrate reductase (NAD(P)H)
MMPDYHIGTLSATALKLLTEAGETMSDDASPRAVFLQSKAWSKAILSSKERISSDTKIFSFSLDHETQTIGLPVGQHLMLRLRDPATREAIIRAYTPISEGTEQGKLHVLVKIYYDAPDRKGGKMTQALDSMPIGHFVEFKGPVGKFEYLGRGLCSIGGKKRVVKRFVMICAGSGITPIYQVLRAVVKDAEDPTTCVVLDGNRVEEDILCRKELDELAGMDSGRCEIVYTLTRPGKEWKGLTGRMDRKFLEERVGRPSEGEGGDTLVLICGPESMENSTRDALRALGWNDPDLLFF